jgi:hypothetical protein
VAGRVRERGSSQHKGLDVKQMLVTAAVILVACTVGYYWLHHYWSQDQGHLIGVALGNPRDGKVELHVVVSRGMVRAQAPPVAGRGGAILWDQWTRDHFDLRDSAGKAVEMTRMGHSTLISDQKACNPEFFLQAWLRAGERYTLDYVPVSTDPQRYRHPFTVPPEGRPFERAHFALVQAK